MNISLITPADKRSRSGNRVTAVRWARLLEELGHRVQVDECWHGSPRADVMVAIHAYRSAESVARFRDQHPQRPLIVLMAGTDIYRFQQSHPGPTHAAMAQADRLVGLHDDVAADLPARFRDRVVVIHQSAEALPSPRRPTRRGFDLCVVGHLRDEKDPLRTALAARGLPASSRVRVLHFGKAHDTPWRRAAEDEMALNKRYHWYGEVPRWQVRRRFGSATAMVISSLMEGGANVVSEAVVAGLPVLASDIAGNRGLLGPRHPAYYVPGDTGALAALIERAEIDPEFLGAVADNGETRRHLFTPARERAAWGALLASLR